MLFKIEKVISERKYKDGVGGIAYIVRKELIDDREYGGNGVVMSNAYTKDGKYIGNSEFAWLLWSRYRIIPEVASPNHSVCSIGFSPSANKYYGWSHRAICGFGYGDKLFEEEYGDDHTPFAEHGEKTIETLEEAKQAAINFARYVS